MIADIFAGSIGCAYGLYPEMLISPIIAVIPAPDLAERDAHNFGIEIFLGR